MRRCDKFRGSRTHGRGMKAGRGAGKRGGKGNAGLHKHKYISCVKYMPGHFGRYGFKRPQKVVGHDVTINVSDVERNMERYIKDGSAVKDGETYRLDLEALGYDKLLGSGEITVPVTISVTKSSLRARSKVEEAGGSIVAPGEDVTGDEEAE